MPFTRLPMDGNIMHDARGVEVTVRGPTGDQLLSHRTTGSPSVCVIEAVSKRKDVDPTQIEPLLEAIDPDALDRLFERRTPDRAMSGVSVAFSYADYHITVTGDFGGAVEQSTS